MGYPSPLRWCADPPPNGHAETRMLDVSTRSLYIEPAAAPRQSQQCEVLRVSPLYVNYFEAADVLRNMIKRARWYFNATYLI